MEENKTYINIDDFKKVEIKAGKILSATKIENADKLLRLEVDFGDHKRQIISGIAEYYPETEKLVGVCCAFATNLEPRVIRGLESQGMIMAVSDKDTGTFSLLEINNNIPAGTKIS